MINERISVMNKDEIIDKLRKMQEKNILITDSEGRILYHSQRMDYDPDIIMSKIRTAPEDFDEQEFFDKENDVYISVERSAVTDGNERYICYRVTDMSEHALLLKEVSSYTKSISNMSKFQTSIMKRLSMSYDTFLPGLADYCGAEEVMMFIKMDGRIVKSTYVNELLREYEDPSGMSGEYFGLRRGETHNGFLCILNTKVQEHDCVVLVKGTYKAGNINPMDISIYNVISLFIENSILRDKIVYESEHDRLTGLYNKGKYMALKKSEFGSPLTISIFNFDVNNLKKINDTYGHEYGDLLIVKAARSIAAVCSDRVFGFRMGGDEYVMVATELTPAEDRELYERWQAALDRLNGEDKNLFCSMACGHVFASGDYEYDELYARADQLMYQNKTELKSGGITSYVKEPAE